MYNSTCPRPGVFGFKPEYNKNSSGYPSCDELSLDKVWALKTDQDFRISWNIRFGSKDAGMSSFRFSLPWSKNANTENWKAIYDKLRCIDKGKQIVDTGNCEGNEFKDGLHFVFIPIVLLIRVLYYIYIYYILILYLLIDASRMPIRPCLQYMKQKMYRWGQSRKNFKMVL